MPRGPAARLFVAADIPADEQEALAAWGKEAARAVSHAGDSRTPPGLRVIEPENIHLTLAFLGSRPVTDIDAVAAVLPACAAHACELEVQAPVWLPRRRPRALAVAVREEGGTELERMQAQVRDALAGAIAWEPDRRRYRPHITVVRVRGGSRRRRDGHATLDGVLLTAVTLPPTPRLRFVPESVTLYRSQLDPGGARYEAMAACRLLPPGEG